MKKSLALVLLLLLSACNDAPDNTGWVGAWQELFAAVPNDDELARMKADMPTGVVIGAGTLRYRVRISAAGSSVRLMFFNRHRQPVVIEGASVARAAEGLNAARGSLRPVAFSGRRKVELPANTIVSTDALDFDVAAGEDLLISAYVPNGYPTYGGPSISLLSSVSARDAVGDETFDPAAPSIGSPALLSRIDVLTRNPRAIVAFGDSITATEALESGDRGWSGLLARRVAEQGFSVVNAGIGGNRLLNPIASFQESGLARLDRDALAVPGITHLILQQGINDIVLSGMNFSVYGANPVVPPDEIIAGYKQIIAKARAANIKVIGATLPPFEGSTFYTDEKNNVRQAVNEWIRSSGMYDGIIDFDAALRDPALQTRLKPAYDGGDHLHPNAAGQRAMSDAIDLALFE